MKAELDCGQFEQRINDLLDQRIQLRRCTLLQQHAKNCTTCSRLLDQYDQVTKVFLCSGDVYSSIGTSDASRSTSPDVSGRCLRLPPRSEFDLQKLAWTMAPCFAALLMVAIGMFFAPLQTQKNVEFAWASDAGAVPSVKDRAASISGNIDGIGGSPGVIFPGDLSAIPLANLGISNLDLNYEVAGHNAQPGIQSGLRHAFWDNVLHSYLENGFGIAGVANGSARLATSLPLSANLADPRLQSFVSNHVEPWHSQLQKTPDVWGLHTAHRSLRMTIHWLQRSLVKVPLGEPKHQPDVGIMADQILASLA